MHNNNRPKSFKPVSNWSDEELYTVTALTDLTQVFGKPSFASTNTDCSLTENALYGRRCNDLRNEILAQLSKSESLCELSYFSDSNDPTNDNVRSKSIREANGENQIFVPNEYSNSNNNNNNNKNWKPSSNIELNEYNQQNNKQTLTDDLDFAPNNLVEDDSLSHNNPHSNETRMECAASNVSSHNTCASHSSHSSPLSPERKISEKKDDDGDGDTDANEDDDDDGHDNISDTELSLSGGDQLKMPPFICNPKFHGENERDIQIGKILSMNSKFTSRSHLKEPKDMDRYSYRATINIDPLMNQNNNSKTKFPNESKHPLQYDVKKELGEVKTNNTPSLASQFLSQQNANDCNFEETRIDNQNRKRIDTCIPDVEYENRRTIPIKVMRLYNDMAVQTDSIEVLQKTEKKRYIERDTYYMLKICKKIEERNMRLIQKNTEELRRMIVENQNRFIHFESKFNRIKNCQMTKPVVNTYHHSEFERQETLPLNRNVNNAAKQHPTKLANSKDVMLDIKKIDKICQTICVDYFKKRNQTHRGILRK
ncbi:hypothetical protein SNEBB_002735 [Seison nebaliae]|nr:hypothetical protein SNEBB_002735 [Seison nebaliae]